MCLVSGTKEGPWLSCKEHGCKEVKTQGGVRETGSGGPEAKVQ